MIEFLKEWQTLATGCLAIAAALIAFAGAVRAARIQAKAAETRRRAELDRQNEAFLAALKADVAGMLDYFESRRDVAELWQGGKPDSSFYAALRFEVPDTYTATRQQAEVLSPEQLYSLRLYARGLLVISGRLRDAERQPELYDVPTTVELLTRVISESKSLRDKLSEISLPGSEENETRKTTT